jgi:hypothetical protein
VPSEIPTLSHSSKSISKPQIAEVAHWVFSWLSSIPRSAPTSHQGECCGPSPAMTRRLLANSPAVSAQHTRIRLTRRWFVVSFALCFRRACVIPGPFWMLTLVAYTILGISCAYIVAFVVISCFPYSLPVTAQNMNYSCLITGDLTIFVGILQV